MLVEPETSLSFFDQKRKKCAIFKANDAIASEKGIKNNCLASDGFRAAEWINELKTLPITNK